MDLDLGADAELRYEKTIKCMGQEKNDGSGKFVC